MRVLLIKDVYKLGHAGDQKKVADGYGRNYLLPQGLAVLASSGALKQADKIRKKAVESRTKMNAEMSTIAEQLTKLEISFNARAGETGKLYGSITSQTIADAIQQKSGLTIKRQQIDMQPLRALGDYSIRIRLTVDLVPEIKVSINREGEIEPALTIEEESTVEASTDLDAAGPLKPGNNPGSTTIA